MKYVIGILANGHPLVSWEIDSKIELINRRQEDGTLTHPIEVHYALGDTDRTPVRLTAMIRRGDG